MAVNSGICSRVGCPVSVCVRGLICPLSAVLGSSIGPTPSMVWHMHACSAEVPGNSETKHQPPVTPIGGALSCKGEVCTGPIGSAGPFGALFVTSSV